MSQDVIVVAKREKVGKSATRDLRNAGLIPATIYGLGEAAVSIAISPKIVARILASDTGMNSLVHLQREGTDLKRHVIIKDVQRDPVTGRLSHVDFMRVDPTHKVKVKVPIMLKGTPVGVKEGGILDFVHRHIEVECLPAFIPGHIDVNIEHMVVGDVLRLDQIKMDDHITVLGDAHNVIASVQGKKADEEGAAAEGEAKEPEVVAAKGKKEEKK
ncbi:MAG: 50S ribosomal protein L25 [Firmicutes bacterium]|nr:50S ribosomal protein L25 [Bacillota bacterium]